MPPWVHCASATEDEQQRHPSPANTTRLRAPTVRGGLPRPYLDAVPNEGLSPLAPSTSGNARTSPPKQPSGSRAGGARRCSLKAMLDLCLISALSWQCY